MFGRIFRLFAKSKDDDDVLESSWESTSAESVGLFCTPPSQLRDNNNGVVSSRTPQHSPVTLIASDQDEQKSNADKEDCVLLGEVVQSCSVDKDHDNLSPFQDEFSGFTCYTSPTIEEKVHRAHDQVKDDEVIIDNSNDCLVDQPTPYGSTAFSSPAISNLEPQSSGISNLSSSSPKIRDLCSKFQNMTICEKRLDLCVQPPKISNQRDGLKWLWDLHSQGKGGIFGGEMGLGKSMQMCIFLAGLFHSKLLRRVLVVVPKTRLPHWIKVLNTVGLSGKIREYSGASVKNRKQALQYIFQNNGILLTTYGIVGYNFKSIQGDSYAISERNDDGLVWDYSILDEGHQIKNPRTKRSKSLLAIPSSHRIILTSRPIIENLKELWALFRFCCPELLGDEKEFKDTYEAAINRGKRKKASSKEKRKGDAVAKDLREHIKPYLFQTTLEE